MVLKFVAVGAGVAIVGTSVGAVVTDGFGYWKTIHWQPLSQDSGYYSGTPKTVDAKYNNKFGGTYGKYLTGLDKKNEEFWNNKYKLLKEDTSITTGKFQKEEKVKGGFITEENNKDKSLHKVCEDAYKANTSDVTDTGGEDKFKKSEVWKYCSPGALTNLEEAKKLEGKIGKSATDAKLLSTTSKDNDWFWKIRNEDFWSAEGEWSGSKATGNGDADKSLFKKEYEKKNSQTEGQIKTIRELCEEAYKEQTNSASNNNSTDAKRFCVLEKTSA